MVISDTKLEDQKSLCSLSSWGDLLGIRKDASSFLPHQLGFSLPCHYVKPLEKWL